MWSYAAWSCFVQFACFLCFFRFPEWLYHSHRKNALMEFQPNETLSLIFVYPTFASNIFMHSYCLGRPTSTSTSTSAFHQVQWPGRIQRWIVSATRPRWRVGQWLRWPSIRLCKLYVVDGKIWWYGTLGYGGSYSLIVLEFNMVDSYCIRFTHLHYIVLFTFYFVCKKKHLSLHPNMNEDWSNYIS